MPPSLSLPSGTGGLGAEGVRAFYANNLIGQFFPPDAVFILISRTIDGERLLAATGKG
jgi:carboxymethylenebutenolidase